VATGKPVILVLLSGSALAVNFAEENVPAILQGWYPGARGGKAIAEILFGEYAPEGKLPVTFYRTTEELPEFTDYSMKGRTYRYMEKEALYPFGYGLSYTDIVSENESLVEENGSFKVSATMHNLGDMDGAQTLQVYVKACRKGAPNWQLKALKKVFLNAHEKEEVTLILDDEDFALYNEDGIKIRNAGDYEVFVGISQPDARSVELIGHAPEKFSLHFDTDIVIEEV
jgi:beta-glucosidase